MRTVTRGLSLNFSIMLMKERPPRGWWNCLLLNFRRTCLGWGAHVHRNVKFMCPAVNEARSFLATGKLNAIDTRRSRVPSRQPRVGCLGGILALESPLRALDTPSRPKTALGPLAPFLAESSCQIARLFRCFSGRRGIYCLRISCAKCCMDEAESGGLKHPFWGIRRDLRITA